MSADFPAGVSSLGAVNATSDLFRALAERDAARIERDQARRERDHAYTERDRANQRFDDSQHFAGHYFDWRTKRIRAVVEHYGPAWFAGKSVLELAAGYGDIGATLMTLGADVTFLEARAEHVDVIRQRYPSVPEDRLVVADLEQGIQTPRDAYDLIIHFGVLYHLDDWQAAIADAQRLAPHMVLETEVCDASDPEFELLVPEEGADHAFSGISRRPSESFVERILEREGFAWTKVLDDRCNSSFHTYDWPITDSRTWRHGQRRFWFCERTLAP